MITNINIALKSSKKDLKDATHRFEKKKEELENKIKELVEYKVIKTSEEKEIKNKQKKLEKKLKLINEKEAKLKVVKNDLERSKKEKLEGDSNHNIKAEEILDLKTSDDSILQDLESPKCPKPVPTSLYATDEATKNETIESATTKNVLEPHKKQTQFSSSFSVLVSCNSTTSSLASSTISPKNPPTSIASSVTPAFCSNPSIGLPSSWLPPSSALSADSTNSSTSLPYFIWPSNTNSQTRSRSPHTPPGTPPPSASTAQSLPTSLPSSSPRIPAQASGSLTSDSAGPIMSGSDIELLR